MPIIAKPSWDEDLDQWVCQKCGFRWAVRRKPDGRPYQRQVPVDAKGMDDAAAVDVLPGRIVLRSD